MTFTFSSSESPSTFECQVDGTGFESCTSPATYSDLGPGSHTFEVRATDQYDNTDATPASRTFTLTDAGIVTGDGTTTTFTAEPGDANNVTVTGGGGAPYVITDTGGGDSMPALRLHPGRRPTSVTCPDTANIVVNLGDGADSFDGSTAAGGNFTINGGNGADQLTGSNGDDTHQRRQATPPPTASPAASATTPSTEAPASTAPSTRTPPATSNITIGDGANDADGIGGTDNVLDTVESITGGNGNDTITGSCFANTLAGQGGNDTLNGDPAGCAVGGGDFMGGGLGDDAMNGLDGTDSVTYTANTAAAGDQRHARRHRQRQRRLSAAPTTSATTSRSSTAAPATTRSTRPLRLKALRSGAAPATTP